MSRMIDTNTGLCAVIGSPVAHSLSPRMHNAAFDAAGLNCVYLAFEVQDLEACMAGMRALAGFKGLSVTIPHKISVMNFLDEIDPLAEKVGCVNTVTRRGNRLAGSITDGHGALRAFDRAGIALTDKDILFLGAGGAARAVGFAIAESCSPRSLYILGRSAERVRTLSRDLRHATDVTVHAGMLAQDIARAAADCDIIIQATPLGMFGHAEDGASIPWDLLRPEHVVFDMVYRPMKTKLIQDAEAVGCRTVLGLEMLLYQATLQFEQWTETPAPEAAMRAALVQALQES